MKTQRNDPYPADGALVSVDPDTSERVRAVSQKLDRKFNGLHFRMFLEDASHVYGYRRSAGKFQVEVSGISIESMMSALRDADSYRSADQVFEDFLQAATQDIITDGSSYWQLVENVVETDETGSSRSVPFKLGRLPAWTIRRKGPLGYYQLVPERYSTTRLGHLRRLNRYPVVRFRLKGVLRRELAKFTRFLDSLDRWDEDDRKWMMASLEKKVRYDQLERNKMASRIFLRRSREVGWTARNLHQEQTIDPTFLAHRNIVFQKFMAECREQLIEQPNQELREIGMRCGFEARVSTPGLRSSNSVGALRQDLNDGSSPIVDLITFNGEVPPST